MSCVVDHTDLNSLSGAIYAELDFLMYPLNLVPPEVVRRTHSACSSAPTVELAVPHFLAC